MYRFYINSHRWKPSHEQWLHANRCLPADDLKRIDANAFQRDVKFSLVGQLLIRYLLSKVLRQQSSSFVVQRTSTNRPFVHCEPPFDFNVSHHNQIVCIAGTFHGRVGCDTMVYAKPGLEISHYNVLRKKFTLDEYNLVMKNPSNFNRLWCLKESYVKYLGMGTTFDLLRLNFRIKTNEFKTNAIISDTRLEFDENVRFDEQIIRLSDHEQQLITLCLPTNNHSQSFVELTIDDILHGLTPFDKNKEDDLISWERFQMKRQTDLT